MILIFGGAYQGKLEYAKKEFSADEKDIYYCREDLAELDMSKNIIYGLEKFTYACTQNGIEARDYLSSRKEGLYGKVLICNDISQGIVPMDETQRAWREMTGRAMLWLGKESESVIRVFCGLPQRIK